jgi:hypothetical protein
VEADLIVHLNENGAIHNMNHMAEGEFLEDIDVYIDDSGDVWRRPNTWRSDDGCSNWDPVQLVSFLNIFFFCLFL